MGLQRKTDSQCGQRTEESGAAELRGAELMDGMDTQAEWGESDDECTPSLAGTFNNVLVKSVQGI